MPSLRRLRCPVHGYFDVLGFYESEKLCPKCKFSCPEVKPEDGCLFMGWPEFIGWPEGLPDEGEDNKEGLRSNEFS
jgi:hypothetical protein